MHPIQIAGARIPGRTYRSEPRRYRDDTGRIDPFVDQDEDDSEWPKADLGGFPRGLDLVKMCLRIVMKDREILIYELMSVCVTLSLLFLFIFHEYPDLSVETSEEVLGSPEFWVKFFPVYALMFFVASLFRAATIVVATIRMNGGDPHFSDGIEAAARRALPILGWALISAVVGWLLALLSTRSEGSKTSAEILSLGWAVLTYFSIPVMLFEGRGPVSAIGRSARIVKRTWRESLAGNFGMGLVFFGFGLFGFFVVLPMAYGIWGAYVGITAFMAYIAVLAIFSSAASGVLVASLYRLARTGKGVEELEHYHAYHPLSSTLAEFLPDSEGIKARHFHEALGLAGMRRI